MGRDLDDVRRSFPVFEGGANDRIMDLGDERWSFPVLEGSASLLSHRPPPRTELGDERRSFPAPELGDVPPAGPAVEKADSHSHL